MEDSAAGIISTPGGTAPGSSDTSPATARDNIAAINKRAHAAVDKAADMATHTADWLAKSPRQLSEKTADYVKAKPLQSVGIAFVSGLLLGKLLR